MKKPYLRKLKEVCGFKVFIVDGDYVRRNLEKDFTNFSQHSKFRIVPKDEFWIDAGASRAEDKFYIITMLVINRLMARGYSHRRAIAVAEKIERKERKMQLIEKEKIVFPKTKKDSLKLVYKKLMKRYNFGKCRVWIVDGEKVRDLFFLDFTEGGHDKVYSFVPKNEIWIDDDLKRKERKFVLLHEVFERNLMAKGMKYDPAHDRALKIEYFCRNHPRQTKKALKKEFENYI